MSGVGRETLISAHKITTNPITDVAWFYSSLAQVSAAIIGLFGAILGSKLIEKVNHVRQINREVNSAIQIQKNHCLDRRRRLNNVIKEYSNLLEKLNLAKFDNNTILHVEWMNTINTEGGRDVDVNRELVLAPERKTFAEQLLLALPACEGVIDTQLLKEAADSIDAVVQKSLFSDNYEKISPNSLSDGLRLLANNIDNFKPNTHVAPFVIVLMILVTLTVACLVWPLCALPGMPAYPKDSMIIMLSGGLLSLYLFFSYQIFEIWRLRNFKW